MSQNKQSAIEAAFNALMSRKDMPSELDPDYERWMFDASISEFFSALVEDEGAVEAAARAMCVYQDHDPDRELESVGKDGRPVVIWMHWKGEARAALRALATRAQGESS